MALRAVCAAAAISVKTAQSISSVSYTVMPGHAPGIHVRVSLTKGRGPGQARRQRGSYSLRGVGPDFRRLGKFGHGALFVVDQEEQVKVPDGRSATGTFDDRLPPFFVVRLSRRLDRRPDIDTRAGLAIKLKEEVLAQQFLVIAPLWNNVARLLGDLLTTPSFRRIEFNQLENHLDLARYFCRRATSM